MKRRSSKSGFTLLEILIVMGLLVSLGYLMFSLLRGSLELWRKGESGRDLNEKAAAVFDIVQRDLRAIHVGESGQVLVDWVDQKGPEPAGALQRMRFVRSLNRAEEAALLGKNETRCGLAELAYRVNDDIRSEDRSLLVLSRAVRSPLHVGSPSVFEEKFFSIPKTDADPFAEITAGVLYFSLTLADANQADFTCWDSTRGILEKRSGLTVNHFPLAIGAGSREDRRDDIFPQTIDIHLVLERDEPESRLTFLREAIDEEETKLEVDDIKRIAKAQFLKIETEWMEIGSIEGKFVNVKQRGVRGTNKAMHSQGSKIHTGESFYTKLVMDKQ